MPEATPKPRRRPADTRRSKGLEAQNAQGAAELGVRRATDVLAKRLGHEFREPKLLAEALTHRSALMELGARPGAQSGEDTPWNERLEFLGDSVLGLCVSRRLMERGKDLVEGELSRIRAALVNEESLADVARSLDVGQALVLGKGAATSGGRDRDSILADALEALLGAVFVDGGYAAADAVVGRLFDPFLLASEKDLRALVQADFKTILQELTQDLHRQTPSYETLGERGPDHDKSFEVAVLLDGKELGRGRGASKKRASQAAARRALERLGGSEQTLGSRRLEGESP